MRHGAWEEKNSTKHTESMRCEVELAVIVPCWRHFVSTWESTRTHLDAFCINLELCLHGPGERSASTLARSGTIWSSVRMGVEPFCADLGVTWMALGQWRAGTWREVRIYLGAIWHGLETWPHGGGAMQCGAWRDMDGTWAVARRDLERGSQAPWRDLA